MDDVFCKMQLSLVNRYKFYFVFYTRFVLDDYTDKKENGVNYK